MSKPGWMVEFPDRYGYGRYPAGISTDSKHSDILTDARARSGSPRNQPLGGRASSKRYCDGSKGVFRIGIENERCAYGEREAISQLERATCGYSELGDGRRCRPEEIACHGVHRKVPGQRVPAMARASATLPADRRSARRGRARERLLRQSPHRSPARRPESRRSPSRCPACRESEG
jgi:hypothetical protein